MISNEYRTIIICIDSYQKDIPEGRVFSPYLTGAVHFESLMQLIFQIDGLLDEMQFPQSFSEARSFAPTSIPSFAVQPDQAKPKGKLGTFGVKIIFRQNASWQGSVVWKEQRLDESFRSALELLFLMNSALMGEERENEC